MTEVGDPDPEVSFFISESDCNLEKDTKKREINSSLEISNFDENVFASKSSMS